MASTSPSLIFELLSPTTIQTATISQGDLEMWRTSIRFLCRLEIHSFYVLWGAGQVDASLNATIARRGERDVAGIFRPDNTPGTWSDWHSWFDNWWIICNQAWPEDFLGWKFDRCGDATKKQCPDRKVPFDLWPRCQLATFGSSLMVHGPWYWSAMYETKIAVLPNILQCTVNRRRPFPLTILPYPII